MLEVKVWGDYACFTRPEMKVERVSYPVMTPSAARGVLSSIFWKPEMRWRVREIHVLKPVKWVSLMRNEINSRQSAKAAQGWASSGSGGYEASDDRAQRHTLALRDVAYVIRADVVLRDDPRADAAKYRDQFRRRVERGQCFSTPCLGLREFSAAFSTTDGSEQAVSDDDGSLGRMLFDLDFAEDDSGLATPRFFEAELRNGVLTVPNALYERRN